MFYETPSRTMPSLLDSKIREALNILFQDMSCKIKTTKRIGVYSYYTLCTNLQK